MPHYIKTLLLTLILFLSFTTSSQCFMNRFTSKMLIETTTGDFELDNLLFQHKETLEEFFGLNVKLYFGTEENKSGNAFFTPHCGSLGCNGKIALGKNLMLELAKKTDGNERLLAVFAHEFAHGMQFKYGWSGNSKWRELHADYLAGFFLGNSELISEPKLTSVYEEFLTQGSHDFINPEFHGTSDERGCAILAGFQYAQNSSSVNSAYKAGKKYVQDNDPCYRDTVEKTKEPSAKLKVRDEEELLKAIIVITVTAIGMISNDLYFNGTLSTPYYMQDDYTKYDNAFGWSLGLRKQWNRSALEYGVSTVKYKPINVIPIDTSFIAEERRTTYFDLKYIHHINPSFIPNRLQWYFGAGLNIGNDAGGYGIVGMFYPLFDRFKIDLRYEIGNIRNQFTLGLIFKYQKDYPWHRGDDRF